MTRRSSYLVVAGVLVALARVPAGAQLVAACRGDVQRFCQGMRPGGGRLIRCLEENAAQLSAGCKRAMSVEEAPSGGPAAGSGGGGAGAAKTACRGDAMRFCSDAIGDQPKLKECLRAHAAQLSDGCKTALIAGGN